VLVIGRCCLNLARGENTILFITNRQAAFYGGAVIIYFMEFLKEK